MKENNVIKSFVAELKNNLNEIEKNVITEIKDGIEKLEKAGPYRYNVVTTIAKAVHDFYDAIQRLIFGRIVDETEEGKPQGSQYHKLLLERMTLNIEGVRPPVISRETAKELDEYLRFRHIFRHTYGYELKEERFIHLAKNAEKVFNNLKQEIINFCDSIKSNLEEA